MSIADGFTHHSTPSETSKTIDSAADLTTPRPVRVVAEDVAAPIVPRCGIRGQKPLAAHIRHQRFEFKISQGQKGKQAQNGRPTPLALPPEIRTPAITVRSLLDRHATITNSYKSIDEHRPASTHLLPRHPHPSLTHPARRHHTRAAGFPLYKAASPLRSTELGG